MGIIFPRDSDFDTLIQAASVKYRVPVPLIKAVIAQESNFNPRAYRGEAKLGDASRGLMQMLHSTARNLGYTGPAGDDARKTGGMYDPATAIEYGTKFLAGLLTRTGGKIPEAISAYNGGFRPELGFGARATKQVTVCLARDGQGKCIRTFTAKPGMFGNQPHVDKVMGYLKRYSPPSAAPDPTVPGRRS